MKKIAEGFINQKSNHLDGKDQTTLTRVQNNSMILLYRFLFLLYAEGKGLLDLHDQRYREYYSFHHIKHFIAETQEGPIHQRFDTVKCSIQGDLKVLFKLVDEGSEYFDIPKTEYFIPAYNGGLFDPQKHPDLEHWEISDRYLADAIDLLSRSKVKEGHRDFVDYSTLEIRNLGSIYEGLLEYKLKIAESDLVVNEGDWVILDVYNASKKKKKKLTDFDEIDCVTAGHLYLSTDEGKRKATGSYYTPDYIVNYIVKKTIGPVVERKWKAAQERNESFIDATLSINILDPAMGSGHFLVGAVDFLSEMLITAMLMDNQAGRIANTNVHTNDWAKREVVSHCIYGVDL
jgi:type I restriction-modification system DNA methylase subunit